MRKGFALVCAALVGGAAVAAPSAAALNKLEITCDADKGKVSGAGNYAAGKNVTLKATAARGFCYNVSIMRGVQIIERDGWRRDRAAAAREMTRRLFAFITHPSQFNEISAFSRPFARFRTRP